MTDATLDRRQLVAGTHGPYRVDIYLLFRCAAITDIAGDRRSPLHDLVYLSCVVNRQMRGGDRYLGALRKITVKAKISIEYPLSIVGTGVLDGP